jgi:hypothetical protein
MPVLVLLVSLSALLVSGATAQAQAAPPAAAIGWSVPDHFGSRTDGRGLIVEDQPGDVRKGPWPIELRARGAACAADGRYSWSVPAGVDLPVQTGPCLFRASFPHEGVYQVRLDAEANGERFRLKRAIVVQDKLIVSIGDSVAAGEGIPDIPDEEEAVWQSRRCHRSARAGTALAAKQIEEDDRHTSVTFVHLACSGATVPVGLTGPYAGVESKPGARPLAAQVEVLNHLAQVRPVDAVLLSVGANDIHFGDVVRFCANPLPGNCFAKRFNPAGPDGDEGQTTAEVVAESLAALPGRYRELDQKIDPSIPRSHIHVVEYFDPTGDSDGRTCESGPPGVSRPELEQAKTGMLQPLNRAVAAAAERFGWDEVTGVAAEFRLHGYCAQQPWVVRLGRSFLDLGGSPALKRLLGTLHPNGAGQEAIGELISAGLEREFFPRRSFTHHHGGSDDGSGWSPPPALPVVLGLILAVALLLSPWRTCFWEVAGAMGKAIRPLILPLFVVIGVGAITFGLVAEILVSFAAVFFGWFLIGRPTMVEAGEALGPGGNLWAYLGQNLLVVSVLAMVAWVAGRILVDVTAYFEAVNGLTAILVSVALILWVLAVALRLVFFADSWLRAGTAFLVGAALLRLAIALGILPGEPGLQDSIPALVPILLLAAGVLLVIDGVLRPLPAGAGGGFVIWLRSNWAGDAFNQRMGTLGSTAVLAASLVLLGAIVCGLFEAEDRGKALQPPEGTTVEAKRPAVAPGGGDVELNRRYAPVLAFTKDERWSPIRVDSYLRAATLYGPEGAIKEGPTLADLDRTCPGGRSDCYRLSIDCDSGEEACAHGEARERDPEKIYEEGAVYVRGPLRAGEHTGLFPEKGPFAERLRTLIQYWYFYYYDEWRAPVFAGLLTQKHEGDWEVVTLGLDRDSKPLFVADSAHCGGSWRRWNEVEASTKLPGPRVHPLVAVAEGSHANYPDPRQKRTSDPGHCAGLPEGVAAAVSYASNIRDKTEYGWAWYPPDDGWIELGSSTGPSPMDFPGTWGASDRTTLTNFNVHEIGKAKAGPKTPSLQPSWTNPVGTIFCGKYRAPVGSDPETFNC